MRKLALVAVIGVAPFANATFDLILAADNTGNFNGAVHSKIHRYDGDSGVYLGAFNVGYHLTTDLAVDKAANEVYVSTIAGINVFDYNTGQHKRGTTTSANNLKERNGNIYMSQGSNLLQINKTTLSASVVKSWTSNITDFAIGTDGGYALFNQGTGNLQGYSSANVAGTLWTVTGLSTTGPVRLGHEGLNQNRFYVMGDSTGGPGNTSFQIGTVSAAGGLSMTGTNSYSTGFIDTFMDIHASHTGFWLSAKNGNTGANTLFRMYAGGQTGDTNLLTPQITAPGSIAVVVAPEPGTFIAVGVGVAALLRRRRKSL